MIDPEAAELAAAKRRLIATLAKAASEFMNSDEVGKAGAALFDLGFAATAEVVIAVSLEPVPPDGRRDKDQDFRKFMTAIGAEEKQGERGYGLEGLS